jgi:hypothetical protein
LTGIKSLLLPIHRSEVSVKKKKTEPRKRKIHDITRHGMRSNPTACTMVLLILVVVVAPSFFQQQPAELAEANV